MNVPRRDHRQPCKYSDKCYQTNPMHKEKFSHPSDSKDKEDIPPNVEPEKEKEATKRKASEGEESTRPEPELKKVKTDQVEEVDNSQKDHSEDEDSPAKIEGGLSSDEETEEDVDLLPESPIDINDNLKQKFLVEFPKDFFQFWKFCEERDKEDPSKALFDACGLKLVGPYDLMGGKLKKSHNRKQEDYLCHYRYYYDVPEFQTVLADPENDFHIGYFRDDPKEMPAFVASNDGETCKITPLGDNLFAALHNHLKSGLLKANPFKQAKMQKLKEALHVYATMKVRDEDYSLDTKTMGMKLRDKKKQSNTFHGAGMVVPYDKENDVGYREIPETTASLKKIFKNIIEAKTKEAEDKAMDVLHELITNVQFANDEGDPGMGLELGIDAFCFGGQRLHGSIGHLMGLCYDLMHRPEYSRIVKAHLKRRQPGQVFKIQ